MNGTRDDALPLKAPRLRQAMPLLGAGIANAFVSLAFVLTVGLLAFAPLHAAGVGVGISAAFTAMVAGGLLYALAASVATPVAGPSSATALILAGLVARLAADPLIDLGSPAGLAAITMACGLCVATMGVLQAAMGLAGLGRLAQFVPQPVLAGFMNGVAVMILVSQLPLLGLPPLSGWLDPTALPQFQPAALLLGLGTAFGVLWIARRWPRAPASLLGLIAGSLLYQLLAHGLPGQPLGALVGELPQGLVRPDALAPMSDASSQALLVRHGGAVLLTAAVLALIGTLESLLAALVVDQLARTRHDSRRELLALGMANLASGLCGGLPVVLSRVRTLSLIDRRRLGRLPALGAGVVFALLFAAGGPMLAWLPQTVLAGIMLTVAWALVDRWTQQLLRQWRSGDGSDEARRSLAQVAVVCAITVAFGFVAGVAAGTLLSAMVFIHGMNRSLLRSRYSGAQRPSRRIYSPALEALLQPLRQRITVLELEGALFFGSAGRLAREAEQLSASTRHLVIDLQRVSTIDETGAVLLQQLQSRLAQRGQSLWLAGVAEDHPHGRSLRAFGCFRERPRPDWAPDADHAIEAAEARLLAEAGVATPVAAVPLAETSLLRGLDARQQALVLARLLPQRLAAGTLLFREGEPGDRLYLLTEGSITIRTQGGRDAQRFVSFSPGVMLGEVALLDGGGRSADALADVDSQVHALTRAALDELSAIDPPLGVRLARNIALHLADRLRNATTTARPPGD